MVFHYWQKGMKGRFHVLIRYGRKDKAEYDIDAVDALEAEQWAKNQARIKGWTEIKVEVKRNDG